MARTPATLKPIRVTKALIDEYLENERERKELERQANVRKRRNDMIRDAMAKLVDANKGKPVKKGAHLIHYIEVAGRVSWKNALIEAKGQPYADGLMQACPPSKKIVVD